MDSSDRRIFEQNVPRVCARARARDGGWRGGINDKRRSTGCAPICVCLDRGTGWRGRIRRSERCRRVRRISILARSSVCSDIWSISIWRTWRVYGSHLLPPHPRAAHPQPPPRSPVRHPRVMDTQGVGDYANEASRPYGWRFMGGPKGNVIVQRAFFLQIFGRFLPR